MIVRSTWVTRPSHLWSPETRISLLGSKHCTSHWTSTGSDFSKTFPLDMLSLVTSNGQRSISLGALVPLRWQGRISISVETISGQSFALCSFCLHLKTCIIPIPLTSKRHWPVMFLVSIEINTPYAHTCIIIIPSFLKTSISITHHSISLLCTRPLIVCCDVHTEDRFQLACVLMHENVSVDIAKLDMIVYCAMVS